MENKSFISFKTDSFLCFYFDKYCKNMSRRQFCEKAIKYCVNNNCDSEELCEKVYNTVIDYPKTFTAAKIEIDKSVLDLLFHWNKDIPMEVKLKAAIFVYCRAKMNVIKSKDDLINSDSILTCNIIEDKISEYKNLILEQLKQSINIGDIKIDFGEEKLFEILSSNI